MSKKSAATILMIAVLFIALSFTARVAKAASNGTVTVPVLNVRSGPGLGYAKFSTLQYGSTYPVIESQNSWFRLQIGSKSGWVHGDYIKLTSINTTAPVVNVPAAPSPAGQVKITADLLNVRQNATASSTKVGELKTGETYQYYEKSGVWYKIKYGNTYGWIHGDYVATVDLEPTAPPPSIPQQNNGGNTTAPPAQNNGGSTTVPPPSGNGGTSVVDSITVDLDSIDVKTDVSLSAPIIGQIKKNESYKVLEVRFGWYKIQYTSGMGWIRNKGVTPKYRIINDNPTNPQSPVTNSVTEIDNPRLYKTATKNSVAIPVVQNVKKDTGVTVLNPIMTHNKSQDGKITLTVNNAVFKGTNWSSIISDNELLSSVSIANSGNNTVTIVLTPKMNLDYEINNIEAYDEDNGEYKRLNAYMVIYLKKSAAYTSANPNPTAGLKNSQGKTKGEYLIALDAGHGGSSSGAVRSGHMEKDSVYDITMRTNAILKAQGYDTYLTRDEDEYVSLSERADGANILKTDIFISIHLNANDSSSPNGTETHYYGNAKTSGVNLAQTVQRHLVSGLGRKNRGIIDSDFAVLNSTYMPAVLAEVLFMSNQQELGLILQDSVKQNAAQSIANAINEYFGFSY